MERTLLLSQSYEPVAAISWQRAMCLIMLGKAEVVEEYETRVRSAKASFGMPAVVRLTEAFRRHKKRVKFSKQNVYARDHWKCLYCGQRFDVGELTYDHVLPRSRGGRTCWENIVTSCKECNARKADRTPQEAGMRLSKIPERPDWVSIINIRSQKSIPEIWKGYCWF